MFLLLALCVYRTLVTFNREVEFFLVFFKMPTRATRRLGRGWQCAQQKQLVAIERKQERQNKSTEQTPLTKKTLHVPEDAFDTLPVYKGVDVYSNVAFADILSMIPDILCLQDRTEHTLSGSSFGRPGLYERAQQERGLLCCQLSGSCACT